MRILIISDTHTDSIEKLPEIIIKEMKTSDMIIHAGDLDNYKLLNEIKNINENVVAVKGNMDSGVNPELLPRKKILQVGRFSIGIMHGDGSPNNLFNRLLFSYPEQDIIIFGHTHNPYYKKVENKLLINPGSVMSNRNILRNSYAILKINNEDYDVKIHYID